MCVHTHTRERNIKVIYIYKLLQTDFAKLNFISICEGLQHFDLIREGESQHFPLGSILVQVMNPEKNPTKTNIFFEKQHTMKH